MPSFKLIVVHPAPARNSLGPFYNTIHSAVDLDDAINIRSQWNSEYYVDVKATKMWYMEELLSGT